VWSPAVLLLAVVPLVTIALALSPTLPTALEFDRTAIRSGEIWRLLTGHLVHFDRSHLLWDLAGFALLVPWLRSWTWRQWAVLLGGAALFIAGGVLLLQPHFQTYRGLSGIDSALFGAALVELARKAQRAGDRPLRLVIAIAAVCFVAKCVRELVAHAPVFDHTATYTPAALAHLVGAWWGAVSAALPLRRPFALPPARGGPEVRA
jgi:rhomboid family GlyGly-CTERM serine protease